MENITKQQRREVLISISRKAKLIKKVKTERAKTDNEALYWASRTVNQMLMMTVYNPKNDKIYKKFNEWKAEGKTILKGSKSIAVWSQPLGKLQADKAKEKGEELQTDEEMMKFFPMCYLFSNLQVK